MEFSSILLAGLATIVSIASAAHCRIDPNYITDCCWGGDGYKSCYRQNKRHDFCKSDTDNYCSKIKGPSGKLMSETCGADCCNILNGWGTGCPK